MQGPCCKKYLEKNKNEDMWDFHWACEMQSSVRVAMKRVYSTVTSSQDGSRGRSLLPLFRKHKGCSSSIRSVLLLLLLLRSGCLPAAPRDPRVFEIALPSTATENSEVLDPLTQISRAFDG